MKNVARTIVFGVIVAAIILGFYFYLSNRSRSNEEKAAPQPTAELDIVLSKNFTKEYPGTPRSVIKWYNRILQLYYDGKESNETITKLADQAMLLWDSALLQNNPRDLYLSTLNASIADYRAHKRKIQSSDVCDTDSVRHGVKDGKELSYVIASYYITEGSGYTRVYQDYCLRKDSSGHWKILAFQLCDSEGNPVKDDSLEIDVLEGFLQ